MNRIVAIDIETYDPHLSERGAGSVTKMGQILDVCTYDGIEAKTYRPGTPSWNELRALVATPNITLVAHNGVYDYDWIQNGAGMPINAKMDDTMTRAGLIDEYAGQYDLDACCMRMGVKGKNYEDTIDAWWASQNGSGKAIEQLFLVPPAIREKYCSQDARATYDLYFAQEPELNDELRRCNETECWQYPLLLSMRKNGIRVDRKKIDELRVTVTREVEEGLERLRKDYGITSLTKKKGVGTVLWALRQLGLDDALESSATGLPSVSATSLQAVDHPIADAITKLKRKESMLSKYLNSTFAELVVGDHIYGTFKPTLRDEGGTVTGRYSSSQPNMQNFSARENKGGELIRGVFIPEEGHIMGSFDYSQIEYRVFAHFAVGQGADDLRKAIAEGADFHNYVMDLMDWNKDDMDLRNVAKALNFGKLYGMGLNGCIDRLRYDVRKVAASMGLTPRAYIVQKHTEYMSRNPFLSPTLEAIKALADRQGFIYSLEGRRHRLPPGNGCKGNYVMPNYLCQGSAAGILKQSAVAEAWKRGVYQVLKAHALVHDEVVFSMPLTKEGVEAASELKDCMESTVKLKVPLKVSAELGYDWFHTSKDLWKEACADVGIAA